LSCAWTELSRAWDEPGDEGASLSLLLGVLAGSPAVRRVDDCGDEVSGMEKFLDVLRGLVLISIGFLCISWSLVARRIEKAVEPVQTSVVALSTSAQKTFGVVDAEVPQIQSSVQSGADSVNTASAAVSGVVHQVGDQIPTVSANVNGILEHVNRDCGVKVDGKFLPCGTLADVAQTLGAYRHTATLVNIAARHEDRQLGQVDSTITKLNLLIDSARKSVDGLQPLETQLTVLIADAQPGVQSADHMLATADEVETKATKDYLHPSKNPIKRALKTVRPFLVPGAEIAGSIAR